MLRRIATALALVSLSLTGCDGPAPYGTQQVSSGEGASSGGASSGDGGAASADAAGRG